MDRSVAALRSRSLFSILTPASKLFANLLVGSAQDVKIETFNRTRLFWKPQ